MDELGANRLDDVRWVNASILPVKSANVSIILILAAACSKSVCLQTEAFC